MHRISYTMHLNAWSVIFFLFEKKKRFKNIPTEKQAFDFDVPTHIAISSSGFPKQTTQNHKDSHYEMHPSITLDTTIVSHEQ